jgi:hypothetical protein
MRPPGDEVAARAGQREEATDSHQQECQRVRQHVGEEGEAVADRDAVGDVVDVRRENRESQPTTGRNVVHGNGRG